MQSYAEGLLLLTIDFDAYTETTLSRYSSDEFCWLVWKH